MACALPPTDTAPPVVSVPSKSVVYRKNLKLKVNGKEFDGVGVVPKATQYQIEGKARGSMDLLTITTCHREVAPAYDLGHDFKYTYAPQAAVEVSNCSMKIEGLDKKHGKHAFGFLDFEDPLFSLEAKITFCGNVTQARGVFAGQCREGLAPQLLEFGEDVEASPDEACGGLTKVYPDKYELKIPKGECVYLFRGKVSHKELRMTTIGYEAAILEED